MSTMGQFFPYMKYFKVFFDQMKYLKKYCHFWQGHPSPLRPWCIFPPPVSDSPYFRKIFWLWRKCSQFYLFPTNFLILFSSAKISDDLFLVIDRKFRISPYFACFNTFPPCFGKIIISSYFDKFSPPVLNKFTCFYILYVYFVSPYFDHDEFMHHPMHVLDAPDRKGTPDRRVKGKHQKIL